MKHEIVLIFVFAVLLLMAYESEASMATSPEKVEQVRDRLHEAGSKVLEAAKDIDLQVVMDRVIGDVATVMEEGSKFLERLDRLNS